MTTSITNDDIRVDGEALTEAVEASVELPKPKPVRKPKLTIVSARKIAAYRAHRTMVAKRMKGSTKSVRAELAAKLAEYDRLLATLKAAA